jgi:hypothetical protein
MRRVSSRAAGHTRAAIGLAQRAAPGDSVRFLSGEASYFVRQGHTHRLPQLLAYAFTRWAGFQVGRRRPLAHGLRAGSSGALRSHG